jgi:hypothetical protein
MAWNGVLARPSESGETRVRRCGLARKRAGAEHAERAWAEAVCVHVIERLLRLFGTCTPMETHALARV